MQVAVLGTGNGALACAGDLALAGHDVRLWGRRREALAPLGAGEPPGPGNIEVSGGDRPGVATLDLVTPELADAVADADVVLVPLPAFAHDEVVAAAAPHVGADRTVVLMPGNLTSPSCRGALEAAGRTDVRLVETATLPYGARRAGARGVMLVARNTVLPAAALDASETSRVIEVLRPLFPQVQPATDVLDAALLNPNVPQHPALVVTNAGPVSSPAPFDIHAQGTTPATLRAIRRVDDERIAVREAAGYGPPHFPQRAYYDEPDEPWMFEAGAREAVKASDLWRESHGLEHRYLLEDAAFGLALITRVGRLTGTPTPMADAILNLAGTMLGRELDREERWLRLGLDTDVAGFRRQWFGRVAP